MTKSILFLLLVSIGGADGTPAQRCEHTDLSGKYDYVTSTAKTKDAKTGSDEISEIRLQIISKSNKKQIQDVVVEPGRPRGLFDEFTNCSAVRSYITGKNKDADALDNDWGDLIVADLNFDNREDFAIKYDSGGNAGPAYEFYTQDKSGRFRKDLFLSNEMGFFPGTIDTRRKRLITTYHADVAHYWEEIFKFNQVTRRWIKVKSTRRKNT